MCQTEKNHRFHLFDSRCKKCCSTQQYENPEDSVYFEWHVRYSLKLNLSILDGYKFRHKFHITQFVLHKGASLVPCKIPLLDQSEQNIPYCESISNLLKYIYTNLSRLKDQALPIYGSDSVLSGFH